MQGLEVLMMHILLVDKHAAFRQALAVVLERHCGRPVVVQAGTLAEGQHHLDAVDLAVVDSDLNDGVGSDLVQVMQVVSPQTHVVALVPPGTRDDAVRGVAAADAVVSKAAGLDELLHTVAQFRADACRHEGSAGPAQREGCC